MDGSWLKLYRSIIDTSFWHDDWLVRLWIWCLVKANYVDANWRGVLVRRGEFITGRNRAAEELGVSPSKWMRGIAKLVEYGCIEYRPDNNWTRISVCNYSTYQDDDREDRTTDDTTRGQPVIQRADTSKEFKKLTITGTGAETDAEADYHGSISSFDDKAATDRSAAKPKRIQAAEASPLKIAARKSLEAIRITPTRSLNGTLQGIPDAIETAAVADWWRGHIGGDPLTGDTALDLLHVLCAAAAIRKSGKRTENRSAKLAAWIAKGKWVSATTDLEACYAWMSKHIGDWIDRRQEGAA